MSFDRYVYPGTNILVNKFGLTDATAFESIERTVSAKAIADMKAEGVTGRFDRPHLQDIHRRIFGDVYDWAGAFRDIQIWKGGTEFAAPEEVSDKIDALCAGIRDAGYFQRLDRAGTADALADVLADLNKIHPFREGNGRTQRAFVSQLALNAGYDLGFTKMSENDMRNASVAAARGNRNLMRYLFRGAISEKIYGPDPVRPGAVRGAPRKQGAVARFRAMLGNGGAGSPESGGPDGPEF